MTRTREYQRIGITDPRRVARACGERFAALTREPTGSTGATWEFPV